VHGGASRGPATRASVVGLSVVVVALGFALAAGVYKQHL
jgi:hypothetical protein